ncbi:MAG: hypothetical protein ACOC1I_07150 [Spirochaetota bacterium]
MITVYQKFIRLLEIEIESLHDEVELVLQSLDHRLAHHEITDYVRNENAAILRNELLGLEDFLRSLGREQPDNLMLDEIVTEVRSYVQRRLIERDYVPALYELVNRRIDRVVDYLRTPASL